MMGSKPATGILIRRSKRRGCDSHDSAKRLVEGRQVTESLIECHASNWFFGCPQLRRSCSQASAKNILVRRHAARTLKSSKKMELAHGDERGQVGKAQVTP